MHKLISIKTHTLTTSSLLVTVRANELNTTKIRQKKNWFICISIRTLNVCQRVRLNKNGPRFKKT